jgi:hypothetical protein
MEKATVVPMICQQMTDPKGTPLEFVRTATMTRRFSARNPKNRKPKPPFLVEYSQPQATGVFDGRMFLFLSDLFEETECWIAAQAIRVSKQEEGNAMWLKNHKMLTKISCMGASSLSSHTRTLTSSSYRQTNSR